MSERNERLARWLASSGKDREINEKLATKLGFDNTQHLVRTLKRLMSSGELPDNYHFRTKTVKVQFVCVNNEEASESESAE